MAVNALFLRLNPALSLSVFCFLLSAFCFLLSAFCFFHLDLSIVVRDPRWDADANVDAHAETIRSGMPTSSPLPGEDGKCGIQHGMAACLPMQGPNCCSTNGRVLTGFRDERAVIFS